MLRTATLEEIKAGKVTDIYFERTRAILEARNIHKTVVAEFCAKSLPNGIPWAIFSGLADVLSLVEGKAIDLEAIPEGSVFTPDIPVMTITGDYLSFGVYETAILGLICQASGIATQAARCNVAAKGRPVVAFGSRRMHPALAPILDRNAYVGGCSGLATVLSGEILGIPATGTIPHALILIMGDTLEATQAFDKIISQDVPRIALVDTFTDEKFESIRIAEKSGQSLFGVRLDTPGSRRGDFYKILQEVRCELDIRGFQNVKLFVSGGIDVESILKLNEFADAYGVGNSISNAPVIDFSMDIVEVDGKPLAKRGKISGHKTTFRGEKPDALKIQYKNAPMPDDHQLLTNPYLKDGKLIETLPDIHEIKTYVDSQISKLEL